MFDFVVTQNNVMYPIEADNERRSHCREEDATVITVTNCDSLVLENGSRRG